MRFIKKVPSTSEALRTQSLHVSRISGYIAALLPLIAALGWVFQVPILIQVFPSLPAMQPNTCLALFLGAIASLFMSYNQEKKKIKYTTIIFAGVNLIVGLASLSEYFFKINLGIDRLLFLSPEFIAQSYQSYPGRPAPQTAANLILLGLALTHYLKPSTARFGQVCAVIFGINATVALTGYIFSVKQFYGFPTLPATIGMAVHTAIAFILLSISLISSHPDVGLMTLITSSTRSGRQARQILIATIIAPPIIGILTRIGVIVGWYGLGIHTALFSVILSGSILLVAWRSARISEQEELLAKSLYDERQIFAVLIENSSDFIGIADPLGKPIYLNPAGYRMVGLADDYPIETTQILDYYAPTERAFAADVILKSMVESGVWKGETYFRHWKTGDVIPVSDEHFMIKEPETGRVLGMGTITRNISEIRQAKQELWELNRSLERKVAERTEALAKSERETRRMSIQFRLMLNYVPGAIALFDREMRYIWVSQRWINDFKLQGKNFIRYSPDELSSEIPKRWKEVHQYCLAGTVERADKDQFIRADGSIQWLRWEIHPWHESDGIIGGIFIFSEDITSRIQSEIALRESERKFRALIESVKDYAIFRIGLDGTILSWNPGVEKIKGYKEFEVVGKNFEIFYPRADVEAGKPKQELQIAAVKGKFEEEGRRVRKDGSEFWASVTLSAIRDENGALQGFTKVVRDISKQIAEIETFKALGEAIPQLCWIAHADGFVFWYNQRWYQYTGTMPQDMKGWGWQKFYDPKLLPQVLERWKKSIQTGALFEMELTLRGTDGNYRWFLSRISPLRDTAGKILSWFGTHTDIDAQKKALIDREKHLQAIKSLNEELEKRVGERTIELNLQGTIVSSMAEGVCLIRATDGEIVYTNPKFEAMLGYESGELIGKPIRIVNFEEKPGQAKQIAQELMQLIREKGSYAYEIENIRKDGRRIWCRATASTFQHPNYGLVFVAVHEDITEKRIAENALRDSEERFRRLFESAHDGILIVDDQGQICQVNDQVLKMFEYQLEDLLGKEIEILIPNCLLEKHISKRTGFTKSPYSKSMGSGLELYGRRKDGTLVPVDISLSPLMTSEGLRVTAIIRDITERRKYERALDERARELARSNTELEQFAYVASHDLREPLRAVTNYAQLLERRYKGKLDDSADKYIAYIVEGVGRMYSLISDLLTYSKVGKIDSAIQDLDMNWIVDETLKFLRIAIHEAHAKVSVAQLPKLKANATLMQQLMLNLISNAIKFRRKGVDPEIRLSAARRDGSWVFSVADNGIGIGREYWDRVFVIFQRLHARSEYPGTGIGLAICKKIVEYHGGKIWLESTVGQGTTFFFEIPENVNVLQSSFQNQDEYHHFKLI